MRVLERKYIKVKSDETRAASSQVPTPLRLAMERTMQAGSKAHRLISGQIAPDISPQGRNVSMASNRSGSYEVPAGDGDGSRC